MDKIIKKNKLFNHEGESFDNPLIGGNTTGLLAINEGRYSHMVGKLYKYGVSIFWIPEKVDLSEDMKQYDNLLEEDKRAYDNILSFLIFLDSIQTNNPMNFSKFMSASEFSLLFAIQTFQEAIHSQSYSYITETVMDKNTRKRVYDLWRDNRLLLERNKYIVSIYDMLEENPSHKVFCRALLGNYILEGIYFYNGFKFFYNLAERGFMRGSANIIKLINRDELYHLSIYENIINQMRKEDVWILSEKEVFEEMETAVKQEIDFSVSVLSDCLGFNKNIIAEYVYYLANKRLKNLGYKDNPWKEFNNNPRKRYDSVIEMDGEMETEENIFTGTSSSYIKSDALDGWDELE